ncbi:MAG: right-handed parallel beta-helix repeat-containing protein [Candidatus Saccharimonadales bacterium]
MVYSQSGILEDARPWTKMFVAGAAAVTLAVGVFASANAAMVAGCNFDDTASGTWSLTSSCTTTGPINIPANTTLDGNGHTISAGYTFGSNGDGTNTVIGVVDVDNVTITDLTIEGTGGTGLHGINVVGSSGVTISDVTINNNDKSGLVVNSSTVTVNNLTTAGNGWHGVNVDKRTAEAASLTINGVSNHTDAVQIYVDDTTIATLVDSESQYNVSTLGPKPNDALYTLKPVVEGPKVASAKDECKNNGWMNVVREDKTTFKNQGQCVAYVQSSENSKHRR